MELKQHDPREFTSTYFALRVGLIFTSFFVISAPYLAWIVDDELPPSISDSWYTDARMIFVLGLAASSVLLIVIRGDTLTEQTFLNVAGWLGLVVAGVACWPKDASGEALPSYPPDVAELNKYAVGALLAFALVVWVIGAVLLPDELVGTGWHTSAAARWCLKAALPALIVLGWIAFLVNGQGVAERAHGPAAVALFVLLGCVAFLRTKWGLKILDRIGDRPVDATVSKVKRGQASAPDRYDWVYVAVAVLMVSIVLAAMVLTFIGARPGLVIGVETALLLLFAAFWGTQTREAWTERRGTPVSPR